MSTGTDAWGLIGTGSPIDELLSQYFGDLPDGMVYELFEDETNALLAALLIEQQGGSQSFETESDEEAVYYSSGEDGLTVTNDEESTSWDFTADSIVVWGWDQPINLAFKDTNKSDRIIPVAKDKKRLTIEVAASGIWYERADAATSDTSINVLAVIEG